MEGKRKVEYCSWRQVQVSIRYEFVSTSQRGTYGCADFHNGDVTPTLVDGSLVRWFEKHGEGSPRLLGRSLGSRFSWSNLCHHPYQLIIPSLVPYLIPIPYGVVV